MNELVDILNSEFEGHDFHICEDFCFDDVAIRSTFEYIQPTICGVKIKRMMPAELIEELGIEISEKSTNITEENSIIVGMVKDIVEKYND